MIDLSAEITIAASPATIAGVMFDPQRYHEWMKAVERVELHDAALQPGARVTHHGAFMGQPLSWTTEVEQVHFPHLLTLRIVDGPLVGHTRFGIQREGAGSRVQVVSRGELKGIAAMMPAAMITGPLQSVLTADLARLKALVETAAH